MNRKEYRIIAAAIHRTATVNSLEKNKIKREAKQAALRLVTIDLTASLKHEYENFNETMFREACGI